MTIDLLIARIYLKPLLNTTYNLDIEVHMCTDINTGSMQWRAMLQSK